MWYPVETGKIVLFPSYLTHQVTSKKGNNTRISLSFNIFLKGSLGSNKELTHMSDAFGYGVDWEFPVVKPVIGTQDR